MLSSSLTRITRQFAQLTVARSYGSSAVATTMAAASSSHGPMLAASATTDRASVSLITTSANPTPSIHLDPRRTFAVNRKAIDAKNAKRLKIQAKKKKTTPGVKQAAETSQGVGDSSSSAIETAAENQPFLQHQEWVKFQQSISVDGFQTGQVTSASVLKKSRGGKQARNKREKELARLLQDDDTNTTSVAQKFPPIKYSDEETQELLKLAFASLPAKTGKRGTRNLKRQARRWKLVRQIRSKYKHQIQQAHERRMAKQSWRRQQTKIAKEAAPAICEKDLQYQAKVLSRWAEAMYQVASVDTAASGTADDTSAPSATTTIKD